jgi:hypothetical protein
MARRSPCFLIVGLCMALWGCGTSGSRFCGLACGPSAQYNPLLYATTTSNQILGFSIAFHGGVDSNCIYSRARKFTEHRRRVWGAVVC